MGDESAYAWMDEAIEGKHVPADQREAYNPVTIFNKGSANICVLNGANDAWFAHHYERHRLNSIIQAWHAYFDCKGKFYHGQSEPFGCFRYASWQTMSLVAMHGLAQEIGDTFLEDLCARWIRYRIFTFGLGAGWWKYEGGSILGPYAGIRSWVGPKNEGGGVPKPYPGIAESGSVISDYSNVLGSRREAGWELEPILQALEARGYTRWGCITDSEVDLLRRVAEVKKKMTAAQVENIQRLSGLIEATGFVTHITIHWFRTTKGSAFLLMRTWSSGSTNSKLGGMVIKQGRDAAEFKETWAGDVNEFFGWGSATPYNRKSDPGGTAAFRVYDDRVEMDVQTNAGAAANGFAPGEGHHYAQWKGQSQDPAAWPDKPRTITLPGELVGHYEIKQKQPKVIIHFPATNGSSPGPEPGDDVKFPGTKWAVRWVARTSELLHKHDGDVDKAKKEAESDPEFQKAFEGHFDKWNEEADKP